MSENPSPFPMRMLYAPSRELMDYAARFGMNWVVGESTGHKGGHPADSPPVYMPDHPRLRSLGYVRRAPVEAERERLRALFQHARQAGLKVVYHSYEPSLPYGFEKAYPKYLSREIGEYYRAGGPRVRSNRNLCMARPEVREAITAKVAELCGAFPEIDGFMYTNNESSSTTKVWHRCEACRSKPFPAVMKMLHDAVAEGIRRSGRNVRLFYRCWGAHETDFRYWEYMKTLAELGFDKLDDKDWLPAYVKSFKPASLHFKPSRDNPAFAAAIRGDGSVVTYKATWADTNLHHPLNPWIGAYEGNDELCEFSFEHCRSAPEAFYVMGRELQRRAKLCQRKGVAGLAGVPLCWGMHADWSDNCARPSAWSLAEANLHLFAALVNDPDAEPEDVVRDYLAKRYGQPLPPQLARMLLDSEDVAADMENVRGVRATGSTLREFYSSLFRYGPMYKDWRARLRPTTGNVDRILKNKQRNVRRAENMLAQIERMKPKLPSEAGQEFELCFTSLYESAKRYEILHTMFVLMWSMNAGYTKPTPSVMEEVRRCAAAV